MIVTIRPLLHTHHEYLACASSPCGRATYSLRFTPDILGAMSLHDFTQMLRTHFRLSEVELSFRDTPPLDPGPHRPSGPMSPGQTPFHLPAIPR